MDRPSGFSPGLLIGIGLLLALRNLSVGNIPWGLILLLLAVAALCGACGED